MVYRCERCGFVFERVSETERCPDCGKMPLRPATAREAEDFRRRLEADGQKRAALKK